MDASKRPGAGRGPTPGEIYARQRSDLLGPQSGRDAPPSYSDLPSAEQVYHDYAPRVYHMARRMVRNETDAEDVVQDVLLQVIRKLPTFRGASALPTWLHRITVNTALMHRRKQAVRDDHRAHDDFDKVLESPEPVDQRRSLTPVEELVQREAQQVIHRAVDGLPAAYRKVFVLADVEGLPNATIAASLGMTLPAIKSRLHRARLLLRNALAEHFEQAATSPQARRASEG